MGKLDRHWTAKKILRRINQGRGSGIGGRYRPWFYVHEVPSRGIRTRIKGWKSHRLHHLLSRHETRYFLILEWDPNVIDIREQYPLFGRDLMNPLSETLRIARELKRRHPRDPSTQHPFPMTTDFLITKRISGERVCFARTIKEEAELDDPKVTEKLEIEREYWRRRGVHWRVVIAERISLIRAQNISEIHQAGLLAAPLNVSLKRLRAVELFLRPALKLERRPLVDVCADCDHNFDFAAGTTLGLVRFLVARRRIPMNMEIPFNTFEPMRLRKAAATSGVSPL